MSTVPSNALLPPGVRLADIPRDWIVVAVYGPAMGLPAEISYGLEGRGADGSRCTVIGVVPHNRDRHNREVSIYAGALGDPAFVNFDGTYMRFWIHEEKVMTEQCA